MRENVTIEKSLIHEAIVNIEEGVEMIGKSSQYYAPHNDAIRKKLLIAIGLLMKYHTDG